MGSLNQLLQWSILNSATASEDAPKLSDDEKKNITPQKFDPELLEAILGKDDATIMKEKMEVIRDTTQPTEDRETCFDDLEMLVEQIDNACNLEPLRMWPALIELLADAEPSIRMNAAWVCGTAVQNNPKAQLAFLNASGLPVLLKMLRTENDVSVRAKLMYSLAGLIKHFVAGFMAFEMQGGWDVLKFTLRGDEAPVVRRKTLFLLNTLAVDNLTAAESEITHGFVAMLVQLVESAGRAAELDIEEATLSLQALLTLYTNEQLQGKMNLSDDLRRQLSTSFAKLKADIADSFAAEELDTINRMCNAV